ncbi:MAG: PD40 domain-containing protein [Melioribacteraceae bacterium]|nr:PD40 domain-containing protein [Melioribacteraceae bacterium]
MKRILFGLFVAGLSFSGCTDEKQETFPELMGEYLGQIPPSDKAELFAPGIVSTGMYERDIAISGDGKEIYYCVMLGNFDASKIMVIKNVNGVWAKPVTASFSTNAEYKDSEPCISPDGSKFFFVSNRPDTAKGRTELNFDIWVMDRSEGGWSEPYNLGVPVNTEQSEFFPSVTSDGTLYFTRDIGRESYIFRSKLVGGEYTEPEKLNDKINSTLNQFNAFIAPDESYIIIPVFGRQESIGATDYFICFNDGNDDWTDAIHLGEAVNSDSRQEYSPYVTRDGKYFFFMSSKFNKEKFDATGTREMHNSPENGNPDIYWISADFINLLKPSN